LAASRRAGAQRKLAKRLAARSALVPVDEIQPMNARMACFGAGHNHSADLRTVVYPMAAFDEVDGAPCGI
jgi:hypothetical protein